MRGLASSFAALALVVWGALGCGASRPALPPPTAPLTPTPDAEFRLQVPPPLASALSAPAKVAEFELANGMRVVVVTREDAPIVSLRYVNHAAGLFSGSPGIAGLTAHALFEGTKTPSGETAHRLSVGGSRPWVTVTASGTVLGVELLRRFGESGIELLAELVRHPVLDAAALRAAMQVRHARLYEESRTLGGIAKSMKLAALLGREHGWASNVETRQRALREITPEAMRAFYARRYGPQVSTLVVVGNMDAETVRMRARAVFGAWHAGSVRAPEPRLTPTLSEKEVHAVLAGGEQTDLTLIAPGVKATDPRRAALEALARILSQGRANAVLRHQRGKTYGVEARALAFRTGGWLELTMSVRNGTVHEALETVFDAIERIREEGVSTAELRMAQMAYQSEYTWGTNIEAADELSSLVLQGLPATWWQSAASRAASLSVAEVQKVAQALLDPAAVRVVAIGNYYKTGPKLSLFGDVAYYDFGD